MFLRFTYKYSKWLNDFIFLEAEGNCPGTVFAFGHRHCKTKTYRFIESFWLEKTSKILASNQQHYYQDL